MAQYRAIFISDVHLGTRTCQAQRLVDFLREHEAETVYLVGDIVDFWRIKRRAVWPQSHNDVLHEILAKVRRGTRVVFIPGNHDDGLRAYCGTQFGGIEIVRDCIHDTADGKRYLIMHGDEYDVVARYARWLAFLGDRGYAAMLIVNVPLNWARRKMGLEYWSLSAYLKHRVKSAVNQIGDFEKALADEARKRKAQGVICGHIHRAASHDFDGIHYLNTGDWVESCTAIVETETGEFQHIDWLKIDAARRREAARHSELERAA